MGRPDYADTFEKFLDYIDEEDYEHQQQLEQIKNQQPKRECQYCKQLIAPSSASDAQNNA